MVHTDMATRTLNAKYRANDDAVNRKRLIFYHSEDKKEIYYGFEDEAEEAAPEPAATAEASPCRSRCCWTAAGLVSTIDEAPLKAVDTLRFIAAQNLKKVDEVPLSKSIKDVVGGKSTLQNQILDRVHRER